MSQRPDHRRVPEPTDIEHVERMLVEFQHAITVIVEKAVGPAASVRKVAARFAIGRGLANRITRLLMASDPLEIVSSLPGLKARHVLLENLIAWSPADPDVAAFQETLERLDRVLRDIAPTTANLIALLSDTPSISSLRHRLAEGFRRRFEIDAVLHGISAECLLATQMFAPASDGEQLDQAMLQLIVGLRAWRPEVAAEIYRCMRGYEPEGGLTSSQSDPLIPEVSSPDWAAHLTRSESVTHPNQSAYVLETNRRTTDLRLGFGEARSRIGSMIATEEDAIGEIGCPVWYPVRRLVLELVLHREVRLGGEPETALFHNANPKMILHPERRRFRAPMPVTITRLPGPPRPAPGLDEATASSQRRLLELGARRLGASLDDFECHRLEFACPPTGSVALITWPLATREG